MQLRSGNFQKALLADIEPAQDRMSSAKQEVAVGLGQKLSDDDMKPRVDESWHTFKLQW